MALRDDDVHQFVCSFVCLSLLLLGVLLLLAVSRHIAVAPFTPTVSQMFPTSCKLHRSVKFMLEAGAYSWLP